MHISYESATAQLFHLLSSRGHENARFMADSAIWLEATNFPGLHDLQQALKEPQQDFRLVRTALGLDLKNISCAYIGEQVLADAVKNGKVHLRNVRHGLFLLAGSVNLNIGIGCPVDPAFSIGGQRGKNPYRDKIESAKQSGIEIDDGRWHALMEA